MTILYNIILSLLTLTGIIFLRKRKPWLYLVYIVIYGILAIIFAFVFKEGYDMFHMLRLISYGLFIHSVVLLVAYYFLLKNKNRIMARGSLYISILIAAIGIYSFYLEPQMLEVNRYTLTSSKVTKPVKIVVLADVQTDEIGEYEYNVFRKAMAEKPDLILMPGDYLHVFSLDQWKELQKKWDQLLEDVNLNASLGVYAVEGNVEPQNWPDLFTNIKGRAFKASETIELKELQITGLDLGDSFKPYLQIPASDKFHIVLGHGPDFSLSPDVHADLLVAGHTHGGQVQLPFFGPIITLSKVPRSWASGLTKIDENKTLIVSRGIGMERRNAPRLRFLCRPEIVVVEVVPEPVPEPEPEPEREPEREE